MQANPFAIAARVLNDCAGYGPRCFETERDVWELVSGLTSNPDARRLACAYLNGKASDKQIAAIERCGKGAKHAS